MIIYQYSSWTQKPTLMSLGWPSPRAFWNRACPKHDWLFICSSDFFFLPFLRSKTSIMSPHNHLPFTGALPLLQCREHAQIVSSFPMLCWFPPIRKWASFLYSNSFKLMKVILCKTLLWDMGLSHSKMYIRLRERRVTPLTVGPHFDQAASIYIVL